MSTVTQEKDYGHVPVLLHECLDALAIKPDGIYVDGTLGRAGHSLEIVKRLTTGRLIGIDRDETAIAAAQERALSPKEIGEITVSDPWQPYIVPDFKNIRNAENLLHQDGNAAIWGKALNRLLRAAMSSRPGVQKEECISCAECQRICPAKVITMVNGKPRIDRKKCIKCFCCQEFCPVGAMKVQRSPIARLLEKI